jgi:hypothetical protein
MPMGLVYNLGENFFEISEIYFKEEEKSISAGPSDDAHSLNFDYPLPLDKKFKINEGDFIIYLFHKDNFAANDIYQVKVSKIRMGWLFPIDSLLTADHDYADNEHFLPYSENAYKKLLRADNDLQLITPNLNEHEKGKLEDFYGSNTIVLILYKPFLKKYETAHGRPFSLEEYLVYLYSLGFLHITSENRDQIRFYKPIELDTDRMEQRTINLKPISSLLLPDCDFINMVFLGPLKFENHYVVRFHLLYQIIELLISKIFELEFKELMPEFAATTQIYESREKLNNLVNEKGRINRLFSNYSSCENLEELKASCIALFDKINSESSSGHAEALYKVRSLLFHNYREIPKESYSLFETINKEFERSIIDFVINFKTPQKG